MKGILQRLKERSAERAKEFPDWHYFLNGNTLYYSNALAGETGELCNLVKKFYRGDKMVHGVDLMDAMSDEIADVLIQLDLLCQVMEIDLESALIKKFNSKSVDIGSDVFL